MQGSDRAAPKVWPVSECSYGLPEITKVFTHVV